MQKTLRCAWAPEGLVFQSNPLTLFLSRSRLLQFPLHLYIGQAAGRDGVRISSG